MRTFDVLIVGSGHGGAQSATVLRQQGFEGTIGIISSDTEAPYERPPLSKEYLAREKEFERILIRPENFWTTRQVELLKGREVIAVDPGNKTVSTADGGTFGFGSLIWAAGGHARKLRCEGAGLEGVHSIRCKTDVDKLRQELDEGARRCVIIGGGYIGLEAAAVLTKLGCEVILLEALDRVLSRVAGQELSKFYQEEHRNRGVEIRIETIVERLSETNGRVSSVGLARGEHIACDMVIVGIGIEPCIAPLADAGATVDNGVMVDEFCRTNLPDVYAIGDCAAHPNDFADGQIIRLESVQNANDMAATAAKVICGKLEAYRATPWFWSNQYDLKLQTVGISTGYDESVTRGVPATRSFSVIYLRDRKVIALDCVNAIKDYVQGRKLVEARAEIPTALLADVNFPLKDLLDPPTAL